MSGNKHLLSLKICSKVTWLSTSMLPALLPIKFLPRKHLFMLVHSQYFICIIVANPIKKRNWPAMQQHNIILYLQQFTGQCVGMVLGISIKRVGRQQQPALFSV